MLNNLCLHTITTRPWSIEEALDAYTRAGLGGITVWRQALEGRSAFRMGGLIRSAGLKVVSLCRGGFFADPSSATREQSLDDNKRAIEEAAALGAPLIVLVCGAHPAQPLEVSRYQIQTALEKLLPVAETAGVRLGIEPLHPMYADSRSAINTLRQANDLAAALDSSYLGVVVDVYHLWWDPDLQAEITRCGKMDKIFAFHLSDWLTPTTDILNDRGIMGEGCIPLAKIMGWVHSAGFRGFNEVEIFSNRWWAQDQHFFLKQITNAYEALMVDYSKEN